MPFKTDWVPPAVFLEHKGVTIYHVAGSLVDNDALNPPDLIQRAF